MSRKTNLFTQVPVKKVNRNMFDLSHEVKMSGKFGYLYPVLCMEGMPGDTIRDQMIAQVRFAPMLAPIMHRVDVKTDFFFVPNRLLWDNWEDFITGGQDGTAEPIAPFVSPDLIRIAGQSAQLTKGTVWDYLGLPVLEGAIPNPASDAQVSILPFKAYVKIWNDYFRDPNLDTEVDLETEVDGPSAAQMSWAGPLRRRGWERDYFTAALPFAQRGAAVLMPLAGEGSIVWSDSFSEATWETFAGGIPALGDTQIVLTQNLADSAGAGIHPSDSAASVTIDGATTTINDFRRALAIQSWMENNARGGGRYIEQIQAHYNVRVPDYRLQRAEYLGGGRNAVTISEVLSTADSGGVPVGDMAGHGISVGKTNRFTYRCQEHGIILGIMTIIPRTSYDQGIPKMFSRTNKFDYAFPELANLGEQQILNQEVFFSFDNADDGDNFGVFGYIPRYAEYKFMQDRLAGDFRDTLDFWHLSRIFLTRPSLDSPFVTMIEDSGVVTPPEDSYRRIFANQDGTDYLWIQLFHKLSAKRPLPYFGVPQLNG